LGEEVENRSPAIVSIKKRQSVPGRSLSALELLLGEERGRGGRKEKKAKRMKEGESRRQDFRAGGLKSVSQYDLRPKRGGACVYIEAGGCAVGAPPSTPLRGFTKPEAW
jgi:hypothetical protein